MILMKGDSRDSLFIHILILSSTYEWCLVISSPNIKYELCIYKIDTL